MRTRSLIAVAGAALALGLVAGPVAAQDYPGTTPTTGPPVCTGTVSASAPLLPNASVSITAAGSCLVGAGVVDGVLQSTAVALPEVPVNGNSATFPVRLPADWELNAFHTISVTDADSGALLLTNRFFVDRNGRITAAPKGGGIPRTGSNSDDLAKGGVALVAAGAVALVVARRRKAAAATVPA